MPRAIAILTLAALATAAHAGDVVVDLTNADAFVDRAVTATRADASPLRGVLDISGYDAATKTFALETTTSGTLRLTANALPHLVFVRSLRQASPMAQTCPVTIRETPGARHDVTIPAAKLSIASGRLTLPASPQPLPDGTVLEALQIDYDSDRDAFRVALQEVAYEATAMPGCSGRSSIGGKGLQ